MNTSEQKQFNSAQALCRKSFQNEFIQEDFGNFVQNARISKNWAKLRTSKSIEQNAIEIFVPVYGR